ncbi:aspartate/glutamate racemase family protein [Planococcus sp. ISL-110]|uniref:maleate cis-trans isomerase family protein n=1 Tax=Planococcus sp. ISL-110 TaxID=2819167 RepID=UPI001BE8AD2C|nr:aspartate/glutamate racemase family protein [Planococcus sp. ISL-110]MBT2570112.1 aspartate/glutamate racemase family protein [Planococcus sp. ISL-110]
MKDLPYGWRGKLGLIYIASAWSMDAEYVDMAPDGVTTLTTRVALSENPDNFTVYDVSSLGEDAVKATKLLAQAPVGSIAFGCTSGSFAHGVGYDQELINRMESASNNIPCTTTTTAVVAALNAFNVKKIAVATPYEDALNRLAKIFLEDSGFSVTNMTGLGITSDYEISNITVDTIYKMAKEVDTADAEAVFISCTGLSAVRLIETLEADLGKPVISSNQATFWHSMKLAGINEDIKDFGSLFRL